VLHRDRRPWPPVAAGLGCLAAVLVLGVLVKHGATPLDETARRDLHGWLSQQRLTRHVVGPIAHERGRYHGSYVTAALPLLSAAILAAILSAGRLRREPDQGQARWVQAARASVAVAWLVLHPAVLAATGRGAAPGL